MCYMYSLRIPTMAFPDLYFASPTFSLNSVNNLQMHSGSHISLKGCWLGLLLSCQYMATRQRSYWEVCFHVTGVAEKSINNVSTAYIIKLPIKSIFCISVDVDAASQKRFR